MKFLIMSVSVLTCMSSCMKETAGQVQETGSETVRIVLTSADAAMSKAIGDGSKVKEVYYTAFVNGAPVRSLESRTQLVDGQAVLELDLVRNVTYQLVFWAQAVPQEGEGSPYDLASFYDEAKVSVDYQGIANDDTRDAFCAMKEILVDGPLEQTVYLRRPFAQVNFGSSDHEMLRHLGLYADMKSETHIYGIPDVLNVLDGSVSCSGASVPADAFFTLADIPSGEDEYLDVNGVRYGYINMNYILASDEGETVCVSARMESGSCHWETELIPNVPVRRNYRTHIVGDLFSENALLSIIVVPDFKSPDNIVGI